MSTPSNNSSVAEQLSTLISRSRCVDRASLRSRMESLKNVGANDPHVLALMREAERSAAEVASRLAALPKPAFDRPTLDQRLPILERRDEIERAIREHQVVVVCGETGSGKTTQLAQICIALGRGAAGVIAHTQPRRLAARSVGARIAQELGVPLGSSVGVKVRFNDQTSERTALKLMTDGMLLAETAGDPELWAYDTIIIDEAHERSLNIDFLLGYLRRLLPRRPDLKVVITSATIDPARFSAHFALPGSPPPPVIEVSGRTYPVEVRYHAVEDASIVDPRAVVDAVDELMMVRGGGATGDVLVFLPGEREIRECERALRGARVEAEVLPVYSRLSNAEQDRIFQAGVRRRVLLATNVAETSLTIPGVRYVVDTGLARISRYDSKARVQRLPIEAISRASAAQRSGRCGRVSAGVCVRLYSERSFNERPMFTEPEIRRTNLAGVILQMKALNLGMVNEFPFIDPPEAQAIREGYQTLFELGALDSPEPGSAITALGRRLARVPADPRIARMVIGGADEGALAETLVLAAALSVQDPRDRPNAAAEAADRAHMVYRDETSDFVTLLNIWNDYRHAADQLSAGELRDWCRQRFLNALRMREWGETYWQLRTVAEDLDLEVSDVPARADAVHRAIIPGLIPHLCCKEDGSGYDYRAARGNVVSIFPGSVLFKKNPKWFVAAELVETTRLYARTLAKIEPAWIEELAGHALTRTLSDEHFDPETGKPSVWERLTLNGLVVVPRRRVALSDADPVAARALFIRKHLLHPQGSEVPIDVHNARVLELAQQACGKLRDRGERVLVSENALVDWFGARLPEGITDKEALGALCQRTPGEAERLKLSLTDVLTPDAIEKLSETRYPGELRVTGGASVCTLSYAFQPGKEHDGVTLDVPLLQLEALECERIEWLVPGMLGAKVNALLKQMPKALRGKLEAALGSGTSLNDLAEQCAQVMAFGEGDLGEALSEAVHVLADMEVPASAWTPEALPDYLRMLVRVVDEGGKAIATSRDVEQLKRQLGSRIRKARAADALTRFQRDGVKEWDFGVLPESIEIEQHDGPAIVGYPALIDMIDSVSLTLLGSKHQATAHTARGVRRLLALACKDELSHRIEALAVWEDLRRWYQQLGTAEELHDQLTCQIVERTFLTAQAGIVSREQLEERLQESWGRLSQSTFEVADVFARTLEPRSRVAQRLSGGTPRLWASSIADIREHATYLMPRGFFWCVPWERLREYPKYAMAMRERLLRLREDGSTSETTALAQFSPHWKRFTGLVASELAAERAMESERSLSGATGVVRGKGRASLPQTRRQTQLVNSDAGEWAMQPGKLSRAADGYRWQLEAARMKVFSEGPSAAEVREALTQLDRAWTGVNQQDT